MRITNLQTTRDIIGRLAINSARLAEAQNRVASGVKIEKMSDDPTSGSTIMQASGSLRAIEQFRRNVGSVGSDLAAEDSVLGPLGDLMARAKELAVGNVGSTVNAQTRLAAAGEVKAILAQAVQIGNSKLGESYLFGGANSPTTPPFDIQQSTVPPLYVAIPASATTPQVPQGMRSVEIAAGQTMQGAHDGDSVFVKTGVLQSLNDLYTALSTNSTAGVQASMPAIDAAFASVQSFAADVGARINQVDTVDVSLDAFKANLSSLKAGLAEVDMETAITEMVARQTAYQAAMAASSKIMSISLTDYIR